MLSEKLWKPDAVIQLLGLLFLCLGLGSLFSHGLLQLSWLQHLGSREFIGVVVNTLFQQLPIFCVVAWFVRSQRLTWSEAFGFRRERWKRVVVTAVGITVLALIVSFYLQKFSHHLLVQLDWQPVEQVTVRALRSTAALHQRLLFGVVAILVAPVVEELLFRGILYPAIKELGHKRLAIWGTSIIFGLIHMNAATVLPLTAFSVLMILLYEETDNLLAPIVSHALFNATHFVLMTVGVGGPA